MLQHTAPGVAFLLLALTACVAPQTPLTTAAAAEARTLIGGHFWEAAPMPLGEPCRTPISSRCSAAGEGFTVEGVVSADGAAYVRVRLDDGGEAYLPYVLGTAEIAWTSAAPGSAASAHKARLEAINAEIAGMERKYCTGGMLRIGVTQQQAIRAWCFPDHVTSTETSRGTREEWIYRHRGTLYFKNGRLTEIRRVD